MELNNYQQDVMRHLADYLRCLGTYQSMPLAWQAYWQEQDIRVGARGVPSYQDTVPRTPHVCLKVPTGGGKTFIACAALRQIFAAMGPGAPRVVVWLVPSDSILTQTIRALSDPAHPYRARLDTDFAGRVGIYTKEQLLDGERFSPDTVREQLTICVLSYSSLRINSRKKDVRKVYQENGNLLRFASEVRDRSALLAGTPVTALIQVLRQLTPVTIVDESHNATSELSTEMLANLNPSFILDLTATPRASSNIIAYVDARELKRENMVKLPVVVYRCDSRDRVLLDAIALRSRLEREAVAAESAGGSYIRPIVLLQAQPNIRGRESATYDRLRARLLELGIPEAEIAIKTSEIDDIGTTDLLSRDCPIRYIITVNALKEGWDCPFAYILASLANKTSVVDVEQIVGRILRQPYARRHTSQLLNTSYVFSCSRDFRHTLDSVVAGLNNAGFSRRDYRVGELAEAVDAPEQQTLDLPSGTSAASTASADTEADDFADIATQELHEQLAPYIANGPASDTASAPESSALTQIVEQATRQSTDYARDSERSSQDGTLGGELGDMLNQNVMQDEYREQARALRLPQFFVQTVPDLFGEGYELLEKENLSEGFSLTGQDAQVSFELTASDMYQVDVAERGDAIPKYTKASQESSRYLRNIITSAPAERQLAICIDTICAQINRNDRYAASEIKAYVERIVGSMTEEERANMSGAIGLYAEKISDKIASLEETYREKKFYAWLDSGRLVCRPSYQLPNVITPVDTISSVPRSLYEAEKANMNGFERSLLDLLAILPNVLWWHRIIERRGFRLNGFINHYPDFMVYTQSGKILLIETKGADRDNSDSRNKLRLGRRWAAMAGPNYRYFMVFESNDFAEDGAYSIDDFAEMVKNL